MQPSTHFDNHDDTDQDDSDTLACRRCGAVGLYWMRVTQADGRSDKHLLFEERTKRRHVCEPNDDAFEVVPDHG